ncbi:MAG: carboxylating nicotinate-nucleotide diphosphorylase [Hyphomicrobiales bacterium]
MTVAIAPLPALMVEPTVRAALAEDLGRAGDITTQAVIPAGTRVRACLKVRKDGRICGLDYARMAFRLIDPAIKVATVGNDGRDMAGGDTIATVEGSARAILTAERVALNFMGRMSGIATATRDIVQAISGAKARICCTRKTTPGLRIAEKYAVRCGGGLNHRFGLDDAVLIKDNHIAIAGGVEKAIRAARSHIGHLVKVECEVDTLAQLREAIDTGVDAVLLDNMTPERLIKAVRLVNGRAITEASGGVRPATAAVIAATGVDLISCGWITHSAPSLDIGLDFEE